MFGASFNLNYNFSIFHVPWNSSFGPVGGISNPGYGLGSYGFEMSGGTYGHIGANFYSRDWDMGSVEVDYPVNVNLTYPSDNTYNRGEWVTINTGYSVQNTAELSTSFPQAGRIGLEFYFSMRFWLTPQMCFYSCITPGFDTGEFGDTITLFEVSPYGATYACPTPPSFECTETFLPASVPANNYGLSGTFDLPDVQTTSSYNASTQCLTATGSDDYATVGLEVFQFIGGLNIPYVSAILGNLSGGECYLGDMVCYEYVLFSSQFNVTNSNNQDFNFCADVYTTLSFPTQVEYTVTDPVSGAVVSGPGQDDQITMRIGDNLNFKYPCNYEFMTITPVYNLENDFSNHTYDEIAFDLTMEALSAEITIEGFSTPGVYIPGFCSFGHPCNCSGTWPWEWECDFCCDLYIPATWFPPPITLGPWSYSIGPLYEQTIPLGTLPGIDWFDDSWELPGFTQQNGTPIVMTPSVYAVNVSSMQNVLCKNGTDGMMEVTLTNGTSPYTYYWSNGTVTTTTSTTQTNSALEAGIAHVLIEDANGCEVIASVNITEPVFELSSLADVTTDVSCNGTSTGSISVNMNGGTPGYTYNWSPAVSTGTSASNLAAGTYDLTVTDANGCNFTRQFEISEPTALTATISSTNINCFGGSDGTAEVLPSGGTYPYTYLWSNGSTTSAVNNLSAGNHTVTVTDAKSCTAVVNFTLTQPAAALSLSAIHTDVSCFDGNDGTIDLTVIGGTTGYTFQWTNNTPMQLSAATEDLTALSANTYNVTVTDANGCTEELSHTISEPSAALNGTFLITDVSCNGGTDGAVNLTTSGGTAPYAYSWSNAALSEDISSLSAGSYTANITDAKGCTFSASATVAEPAEPLTGNISVTNVLCFGDATGMLDLNVEGGTSGYSFNWSNASTTEDVTGLTAGNYSVDITDAKGCTLNLTATIAQPAAALSSVNVTTAVNCYDGTDGAAQVTVSGGTTPYSYQWNNSSSVIISDTDNALNAIGADDYTVDIEDANGCHFIQTLSVTQPAQPVGIISAVTDNVCFGATAGQIDITVTGGTTAYGYSWSNGNSSEDITALTSGTYTVTVTDANGCVETHTATITEPSSAVSASIVSQNVRCSGGSNGYAQVTASGGTMPYTYSWSNGVSTDVNDGLVAGIYTVTVTDVNGCTANSGVNLTEPTSGIGITNTTSNVTCHGLADGTITVNITGGTTPYAVYFGDTTNAMFHTQNNYTISELIAGTYHVITIDASGCSSEAFITVTEPDTISLSFITTPASCYNGSDGTIDLTVSGGTPAFTYLWTNGLTTEDISGLTAGTYTVLVKDANSCTMTGSATVEQPAELITTGTVSATTCIDETDGKIEIVVSGGVGGYNYLWSNAEITQNIYNLSSGEYFVSVTDGNGCLRTDTFFVNITEIECLNPPNAFTPDGDGYNDTWVLDNLDLYPASTVQIFNKWGMILYETNGTYVPWDGTYKGGVMPAATYYYIIDLGNGSPAYTGHVTIVKAKNN